MTHRDYVHHATDGDGIVVHWDSESCIHSGVCLRRLPEVFRARKRPWVDPMGADADAIEAAVRACPSAALEYSRFGPGEDPPVRHGADTSSSQDAPGAPPVSVAVLGRGPYLLKGPVEILDADGNVARTVSNVALCRCGHSSTKPFCDGSHHRHDFDDAGIVPAEG